MRRAAFFGIGRREIYHNRRHRKIYIAGTHCGAYPVAAFLNGYVGQSDYIELRLTAAYIYFNVYLKRVETEQSQSGNLSKQSISLLKNP